MRPLTLPHPNPPRPTPTHPCPPPPPLGPQRNEASLEALQQGPKKLRLDPEGAAPAGGDKAAAKPGDGGKGKAPGERGEDQTFWARGTGYGFGASNKVRRAGAGALARAPPQTAAARPARGAGGGLRAVAAARVWLSAKGNARSRVRAAAPPRSRPRLVVSIAALRLKNPLPARLTPAPVSTAAPI
jgi:hypothetical protein